MDLPPDYPGVFPHPGAEVSRPAPPRPQVPVSPYAPIATTMLPPAGAGAAGHDPGRAGSAGTSQDRDLWIYLRRCVNGAGFDLLAEQLGLPESEVKRRFDDFCRDLAQERSDASPPFRRP